MKSFASMATLSVLNYNLPPGLTMKLNNANQSNGNAATSLGSGLSSKTFNKITVQNVLSENNANALNIAQGNPNAIVRKIKDFGMIGTVNGAGTNTLNLSCNARKRPLSENQKPTPSSTRKEKKSSPSVAKKPKLSKEERTALRLAKKAAKENSAVAPTTPLHNGLPIKIPGTPGRKGLPLPQAVARRNARERNRVKQVNNGFAALRERIPEEVAEAFEAQSTCKNNGKKLSKVETLRMAVEYIRSLERLLGFDFPIPQSGKGLHSTSSSGEDSFSMIKDEFDAFSPSMDEHFDDSLSHYDSEEYFGQQTSPASHSVAPPPPPTPIAPPCESPPQMDMLPNITTLNGLQYIRIPGTNTYQLLTPDIFVGTAASPPSSTVDEEHFNALIDTNCVSPTSMSMSSPTSASLAHVTADLNSSPPSITMAMAARTETAPVSLTNTKCVNAVGSASLLSTSSSAMRISPVPLQQQQQQQHHQQMMAMLRTMATTATTLSSPSRTTGTAGGNETTTLQATTPAAANEHHRQQQHHHHQMEGLRQACAVNQQQQPQQPLETHVIKQEFEEPTIIYQPQQSSPVPQQQQHLYLPQHSLAMSPPLDRQTPNTSAIPAASSHSHLQQFYQPASQAHYFEGVVNLKKEFTEDLLDGPHTSNVLSDESMIESIDWWDAHTPKSEGGSGHY